MTSEKETARFQRHTPAKRRNGLFVLTMWWFVLCAITGLLVLFFTPDRERISQDENRVLQNTPDFSLESFRSGEYASQFEDFLSDSVPFRKAVIGVSQNILGFFSMNSEEDLYYLDTTAKEVAEYQGDNDNPHVGSQEENGTAPDDGNSPSQEGGGGNDATFELVKRDGGTTVVYTYPYENLRRVADNIQEYADLLPEDGRVYFTMVPFPGLARRFTDSLDIYSGWKCNALDEIGEMTSDKVKCFDTLSILEPYLINGENLFLYGNHQWNIRGSYYVYCEMIKSQGLTPTPYDEYDYKVNRPENPTYTNLDSYELLYPLAPSENYRVEHIDHRFAIPFMSYNTATTSSYLYGNVHPWKTVITGFHTGRKALVIGDCFDLSMTPFLLPYYDEVHKTDVRYRIFNRSLLGTSVEDMMKRNSIDDIYLIFSEANDFNSATLLYALPDHLH